MPRQQRQADDAAAQNWDVCTQVPCRGRPGVNREYSAFGAPDSLGAHTPKKPATL
jgi:hypothetical protein